MSARLFAAVFAGALLFAPVVVASGAAAVVAQPSQVSVKVGGKKVLNVTGVERVAVGNPDVADIRVEGKSIEVTGRSPGTTTVQVWRNGQRESYAVTVTP